MHVSVRGHHDLNNCFDVAKLIILTPLSIVSSCRLSFLNVGSDISTLPNFSFKSPKRIFVWYWGIYSKTWSYASQKLSFLHNHFLLLWCTKIKDNDTTPATSQNYIWHHITNIFRPQCLGGLSRGSAAIRLLILWVRMPPGHGYFVLPVRGLCDELIIRPEESYQLCYVVVCDLGTSGMRRPWMSLGYNPT